MKVNTFQCLIDTVLIIQKDIGIITISNHLLRTQYFNKNFL